MDWKEVRRRIGSTLPAFMNVEKRWPSPDEADFWKGVLYYDEIKDYLGDQMSKLAETDEEAAELMAIAYGLVVGIGSYQRACEDPRGFFKDARKEILSEAGIYLQLRGSLLSVLLERLGVPRWEINEDMLGLLSSYQKGLDNLGPGGKALLWWAVFVNTIGGGNDRDIAIDSLVELGLNPPEVL